MDTWDHRDQFDKAIDHFYKRATLSPVFNAVTGREYNATGAALIYQIDTMKLLKKGYEATFGVKAKPTDIVEMFRHHLSLLELMPKEKSSGDETETLEEHDEDQPQFTNKENHDF